MRVVLSRTITAGLVASMALVLSASGAGATPSAAASCPPGSGRQLAGRTLTNSEISGFQPGELRCADLAGANLSGLSLIQVDLTGADLSHANLQHANLTQATLTRADLAGANLTGATLDQSMDQHASFRDANLSGASAIQVDLTGASLEGADLSGTDFTQATFTDTKLQGATGLFPWSLYLLIAAGLLFVLLLMGTLRKARRSARPGRTVVAVLGCLVAAFGFHLFAGGLIGQFVGGFGTPVTQVCSGPQCAVGVASGVIGIPVGVLALIVGLMLRARRGAPPPVTSGQGPVYWAGGGGLN
jgi:uncharacterized protein YjbI with pentapeptide repeats